MFLVGYTMLYNVIKYILYTNLVGGKPIPLKNLSQSVGGMNSPIVSAKNNPNVPNHLPVELGLWSLMTKMDGL